MVMRPRGQPAASPPSPLLLVVYLVVCAVLVALYYVFPGNHLQLWTPLGLLAVVAMVVGIRRRQPDNPAGWYLLTAATFCFIMGDTTWNFLSEVLGQDNPYPSLADPLYLLTYPLFAAGLAMFIRARSTTRDRGSVLDSSIATTGVGLLVWVYLVQPYFEDDALTFLQQSVSMAYPLGDVLVLGMFARLITSGGLRIRSTQLLALGAVGLLISDILYGLSQLRLGLEHGRDLRPRVDRVLHLVGRSRPPSVDAARHRAGGRREQRGEARPNRGARCVRPDRSSRSAE